MWAASRDCMWYNGFLDTLDSIIQFSHIHYVTQQGRNRFVISLQCKFTLQVLPLFMPNGRTKGFVFVNLNFIPLKYVSTVYLESGKTLNQCSWLDLEWRGVSVVQKALYFPLVYFSCNCIKCKYTGYMCCLAIKKYGF